MAVNSNIPKTNFTTKIKGKTIVQNNDIVTLDNAIKKLENALVNVDNCGNCANSNCCQSCQTTTCQRQQCPCTCYRSH